MKKDSIHIARIQELENLIHQARIYSDESDFDCPLCLDFTKSQPTTYCSFHQHIAKLEQQHDLLYQLAQNLVQEHNQLITDLQRELGSNKFKEHLHMTKKLNVIICQFNLKINSMARMNKLYNNHFPQK